MFRWLWEASQKSTVRLSETHTSASLDRARTWDVTILDLSVRSIALDFVLLTISPLEVIRLPHKGCVPGEECLKHRYGIPGDGYVGCVEHITHAAIAQDELHKLVLR